MTAPDTTAADTAEPSGRPVVAADGVDLVRNRRALLDQVSMVVRPGEHWALIGPNGAGKSTLVSLLSAQQHPTRGSVEVLGRLLGRTDMRELRRHIGHVNPRHDLRSALPGRAIVLTGATGSIEIPPRWEPSAAESERAEYLMDLLGVTAQRDALWPTLSQGERGRILIARALMPTPRLLLLDEPATGLDVAAREQLLASIDQLRREHPGLATVLVTHHLEELPESTTHAMLLRSAQVVASGAVGDVLTTKLVSTCFDHPIEIERRDGRWSARAARTAPGPAGL
ncbi:iron complex transport system ATP-binding protein [Murinocardiopsis flavida]|uniref:Iron complex transport system ATP-binding protein n=1 Tax=Murinocardiopsis flavida TaxID=645275 RepID=A0A2P8DUC3_9ACTN|nr:ATP-binding cassette domain-containing protein [Murinocardiopsis flavida]PSL00805.1 iron complex transport system ATP-binding protein [Murinocardiopsis flavida]